MFICIYQPIYPFCLVGALRSLCAATVIQRCCRRPYCAATGNSRRSHCAFTGRHSHSVCFEHVQSARCLPAITGDATAFLAFRWRAGLKLSKPHIFNRHSQLKTLQNTPIVYSIFMAQYRIYTVKLSTIINCRVPCPVIS